VALVITDRDDAAAGEALKDDPDKEKPEASPALREAVEAFEQLLRNLDVWSEALNKYGRQVEAWRQPPGYRSRGSFWRAAVLWFPALNFIAMSAAVWVAEAFVLVVVVALLAEFALLIARARRCGVGDLQVAVAMLANVGLSIILVTALIAILVLPDLEPNLL